MERLVLNPGLDTSSLKMALAPLVPVVLNVDPGRWPYAVRHWVAPVGGAALEVDDDEAGWSYLLVPSASAALWRSALKAGGLLVDREAALVLLAAGASGAMQRAVSLLGLLAHGPFDPEIYGYLVAALASPDSDLREEALSAITMSSWPEFEAALRATPRATDAGEAWVREADEVAAAMAAGGWNADFYAADPPAP